MIDRSDVARLFELAVRAKRSGHPRADEWLGIVRDELLSDVAKHLESDDPTIREEPLGFFASTRAPRPRGTPEQSFRSDTIRPRWARTWGLTNGRDSRPSWRAHN